jgi:pilus assembly protein CpaC
VIGPPDGTTVPVASPLPAAAAPSITGAGMSPGADPTTAKHAAAGSQQMVAKAGVTTPADEH